MSGDEGRAIWKTVCFRIKYPLFREMPRAQTRITVTALTFSANARHIFRKPIECLSGRATKPLLSKIKETDRVTTCVKLKKNRAITFSTNKLIFPKTTDGTRIKHVLKKNHREVLKLILNRIAV